MSSNYRLNARHPADVIDAYLARKALEAQTWAGALEPLHDMVVPKVLQIRLNRLPMPKVPQQLIKQYPDLFPAITVAYAEVRILEGEAMVAATPWGPHLMEHDATVRRALEEKKPIVYFTHAAKSKESFNEVAKVVLGNLIMEAILVMPKVGHAQDIFEDDLHEIGRNDYVVSISRSSIDHSLSHTEERGYKPGSTAVGLDVSWDGFSDQFRKHQ